MNERVEDKLEGREHDDMPEVWVNEFTEESVKRFYASVNRLAMNGPDFPILVYIDSYGGFADSLMAMLDILDSLPNPVITVAVGKACSCGAILLSAGDYRYCGRNTRVMIHRSSAGSYGNMRNLTSDIKEMERVDHHVMDLFARNCGMAGKEELFQVFKDRELDDLWMSADEAKYFGLVDNVGLPRVSPRVQWTCSAPPPKPSKPIKAAQSSSKRKKSEVKKKKKG